VLVQQFGTYFLSVLSHNFCNVCKHFCRKIKDNEELEAATKLAQKEEMERLQRLQEIQEQVWQQAALDLRLYKEKEVKLLSPVPTVELELPAVKSEPESVVSPITDQPTSFLNSSATEGDCVCVDHFCCENVYLSVIEF